MKTPEAVYCLFKNIKNLLIITSVLDKTIGFKSS